MDVPGIKRCRSHVLVRWCSKKVKVRRKQILRSTTPIGGLAALRRIAVHERALHDPEHLLWVALTASKNGGRGERTWQQAERCTGYFTKQNLSRLAKTQFSHVSLIAFYRPVRANVRTVRYDVHKTYRRLEDVQKHMSMDTWVRELDLSCK